MAHRLKDLSAQWHRDLTLLQAEWIRSGGMMTAMRTRYRVWLLAALGAAVMASVGFASIESAPSVKPAVQSVVTSNSARVVTAPVVWHLKDAASASLPQPGFDAVGLVMAGSVLFGIAAVIRKAV